MIRMSALAVPAAARHGLLLRQSVGTPLVAGSYCVRNSSSSSSSSHNNNPNRNHRPSPQQPLQPQIPTTTTTSTGRRVGVPPPSSTNNANRSNHHPRQQQQQQQQTRSSPAWRQRGNNNSNHMNTNHNTNAARSEQQQQLPQPPPTRSSPAWRQRGNNHRTQNQTSVVNDRRNVITAPSSSSSSTTTGWNKAGKSRLADFFQKRDMKQSEPTPSTAQSKKKTHHHKTRKPSPPPRQQQQKQKNPSIAPTTTAPTTTTTQSNSNNPTSPWRNNKVTTPNPSMTSLQLPSAAEVVGQTTASTTSNQTSSSAKTAAPTSFFSSRFAKPSMPPSSSSAPPTSSSSPSTRNPQSSSIDDMLDVSNLKTAFLKSVQINRERRILAQTNNKQPQNPSHNNTTPRGGERRLDQVLRENAARRRAQSELMSRQSGGGGANTMDRNKPSTSSLFPLDDDPFSLGSSTVSNHNNSSSSWRQPPRQQRGGAKEFRERKKAAEQRAAGHHHPSNTGGGGNYQRNNRFSPQNIFAREQEEEARRISFLSNTLKDTPPPPKPRPKRTDAKQRGDNDDKTVVLPSRGATLTVFSSLLRVKIDVLRKTLVNLGESVPKDAENHIVDVDVMELVALELGFEASRDQHRADKRHRNLKEAEQRQRRVATGASLDNDGNNAMDTVGGPADNMEEYESYPPRPPVVCIMGHVDHGKTTLMDALRRRSREVMAANGLGTKKKKSSKKKKKGDKKAKGGKEDDGNVAGTEAGGITQSISAFQVPLSSDAADSHTSSVVTFLDTPGHAAFKAMRESGTNAADVIVLVIAADDGVSPQTVEVLNFYKSVVKATGGGGISLVIAMTKIDKHGLDVDESITRIENQLLEHDIYTENMTTSSITSEYGSVQLLPVSGMTGDGLDDLIEGLALQSEIMDLRADATSRAEGIVMDARVERGAGVVADCVVRWGTLKRGDYVISGIHGGKVKSLSDTQGNMLTGALPSQPVRIVGFGSLPKAGDPIVSVGSEEIGRSIVDRRKAAMSIAGSEEGNEYATSFRAEGGPERDLQVVGIESKDGIMMTKLLGKYDLLDNKAGASDNTKIRIPVILIADANGTLDAVREALISVGSSSKLDLVIDPVSLSTGPITTSNVRMAIDSGAAIFAFNLKGSSDAAAMSLAEKEGVEIRSHNVIYRLLDDAKEVFAKSLPPVKQDKVHGRALVQATFDVTGNKSDVRIAGLRVQEGYLYKTKSKASSGEKPLECYYRVLRNGTVVSPEKKKITAASLRKVKEDVDDVRRGEECGLGLEGYSDIQAGDIIECYSTEMKSVFM